VEFSQLKFQAPKASIQPSFSSFRHQNDNLNRLSCSR